MIVQPESFFASSALLHKTHREAGIIHDSLSFGVVVIERSRRREVVDNPVNAVLFSNGLPKCLDLFLFVRGTGKELAIGVV